MNKNIKKISIGLGTVAAMAAPIATVVACGSDDTIPWSQERAAKEDVVFGIGVPDDHKISDFNDSKKMNKASKEAHEIKTEIGYKNVVFNMSTDNESLAQSIISGKIKGAFLPSGILDKYQNLNKLKIAFLAARKAMKLDDNGNLDNILNAKDIETKLVTRLNEIYAKIKNDILTGNKISQNVYDDGSDTTKLADFYRAEIYIDSTSNAKTIWQNERTKDGLKKFMNLGVITHSASSESGYKIPEKMIGDHFKVQNFKFANYQSKTKPGKMNDLDNEYHIYLSYAGEQLQNDDRDKLIKNKNIKALALSKPIKNDGFAVSTRLSTEETDKIYNAFETVAETSNNAFKQIFYHYKYKKQS